MVGLARPLPLPQQAGWTPMAVPGRQPARSGPWRNAATIRHGRPAGAASGATARQRQAGWRAPAPPGRRSAPWVHARTRFVAGATSSQSGWSPGAPNGPARLSCRVPAPGFFALPTLRRLQRPLRPKRRRRPRQQQQQRLVPRLPPAQRQRVCRHDQRAGQRGSGSNAGRPAGRGERACRRRGQVPAWLPPARWRVWPPVATELGWRLSHWGRRLWQWLAPQRWRGPVAGY